MTNFYQIHLKLRSIYLIKMFWLKSFFSSIYTGILYLENIAFINPEYVSIFFVITPISLYLYPLSRTFCIILLAIYSISEYGLLVKKTLIFSGSSSNLSYIFE